jgi:hypothetical protein
MLSDIDVIDDTPQYDWLAEIICGQAGAVIAI